MKLLVIGASGACNSRNQALAQHAAARLQAEWLPALRVEKLDPAALGLPLYTAEREAAEGVPAQARRFFEQIGAADAVIISYAEHNGLYTAAFKNLFDWASRIAKRVWQDKPVLALATSIGGRGGANVLSTAIAAAPFFGAELVAALTVPRFDESFDLDRGALRDARLAKRLGVALGHLACRLAPTTEPAATEQATTAQVTTAQAAACSKTASPQSGAAFWDARYREAQAAYGSAPNDFLAAVAPRIPAGPVLVLAAGEGRDAVHLASLGHAVTAVDLSAVGLDHAAALASERGQTLTTRVADLADYDLGEQRWAGIVAIWAHLPPALRRRVHAKVVRALRPGGAFVLEAYRPAQLATTGQGGPLAAAWLFGSAQVRAELDGLSFELCQDVERVLHEGRDHSGPSATVQVLARRP